MLGITQPDLAEMAGLTVNTIYNIESGRGGIQLSKN
jgi:DNA-binding XRE family transcriptional regulator